MLITRKNKKENLTCPSGLPYRLDCKSLHKKQREGDTTRTKRCDQTQSVKKTQGHKRNTTDRGRSVVLCSLLPHSFPGCTPPSSYPPVPGRWWWWEPRRCWRRRRERRQSRWRRRWTSPSCCRGSGLCPPLSHPPSAAEPWKKRANC